jgi:colanic acid biosynthesis glycosyl transferase WcaI
MGEPLVPDLAVGFVCQWYRPEPVSQPGWIVDALRRRGADVAVLTGIPNYPTGVVADGYRPHRTYVEEVDGVRVRRTPLYPSHDSSAVRRVFNYASWALSSTLFGVRQLKDRDVVLVYSSPATAALPAMVASRLHKVPFVLLIQDVWPDSIFSTGFLSDFTGRLLRRPVDWFVRCSYKLARHILVTSPGMLDLLASRGVAREKMSLVYNWVVPEPTGCNHATPSLRDELGIGRDAFVIMYAGNLGAAQALDSVVEAMGMLDPSENHHLVLVGDGMERDRLEHMAARMNPGRIHFTGPRPRSEMHRLMSEADLQLVSLASRLLFRVTTPSKLQSILAAGQPVLVSAEGDAARVVEGSCAGRAVPPGNPHALADAIRHLGSLPSAALREMGARGRAVYEAEMSESVGAETMMTTLRKAAGGQPVLRKGATEREEVK